MSGEPLGMPPPPSSNVIPYVNMVFLGLGEDDLTDVMEAVVDVAAKWKFIGMALGIKRAELNTIASKHASDAKECLSDMLCAWLQQCYDAKRFGQPSWKLLCQAVRNTVGGNNPALANKIAKKYMKSSSS